MVSGREVWRRGSGGQGHYRKAGSVNHQRQPAAKSRQHFLSRVRPGEHRTPGAERNGVQDFPLFTKSAPRPSKEREEGAAERSRGGMRPGSLSGMANRVGWAELLMAAWKQGLAISHFGFSRKNEAGRLSWAFKLVTTLCFSPVSYSAPLFLPFCCLMCANCGS